MIKSISIAVYYISSDASNFLLMTLQSMVLPLLYYSVSISISTLFIVETLLHCNTNNAKCVIRLLVSVDEYINKLLI